MRLKRTPPVQGGDRRSAGKSLGTNPKISAKIAQDRISKPDCRSPDSYGISHHHGLPPPKNPDGQIDIILYEEPIGTKGPRILVQIKHKGQAITMEGLKNFLSELGSNDFGLLVSSGGFTREVRVEIRNEAFQKLTIWDLEKFFDLWIRYYDHLSQEARNRLPLKAIHFIYRAGDF